MPTRKPSETFTDRVLTVVKGIPKGSTLSYSEVAKLAGSPGAARAVGSVMAKNFRTDVPCHRVIKADGTPGHYNRGGSIAKVKILHLENVEISLH